MKGTDRKIARQEYSSALRDAAEFYLIEELTNKDASHRADPERMTTAMIIVNGLSYWQPEPGVSAAQGGILPPTETA